MKKNLLPYMAHFSNEEFKIAYELVCSRLEGEEFTVEDVQLAFDNANEYISELEILRSDGGPHPLTKPIAEKRNLRYDYLISLRGRVTYFLKSPIQDEREAAQVLSLWLSRFSKNYARPSINKQTEMVNNMCKDLAESDTMNDAFITLALLDTFDQIQSISMALQKQHAAREEERRASVLKATNVRNVAYDKMKTFRTTIETAIKLGKGDIDKHLEYFRIINFALADTKALYLSNTTRRKNAALKAEEENENAGHEDGGHDDSTNGSGENRSMFSSALVDGIAAHNDLSATQATVQNKTMNGGAVRTIPVNSNSEHDTAVKPEIVDVKHGFATNGSDRESKNENLGS